MNRNFEITNNSTIYDGEVSLSLRRYGKEYYKKTIHNNATKEFLNYVARAVSLTNTDVNDRPGYILPLGENDKSIISFPVLYESSNVTDVSNSSDGSNSSSVEYSFMIPDTLIQAGSNIEKLNLLPINLYKDNNGRYIPYAYISLESPIEVEAETSIYLKWKLKFSAGNVV